MEKFWKDVKGFEGLYEISNYGEVRSLKRRNAYILSGTYNKGYVVVILSKNKKTFRFSIHRLVAEAFLDFNIESDLVIHHKNHKRDDNRLCNLEIVTKRENSWYKKNSYKNTSKFIGVHFNKTKKKWVSQIMIDKNIIYLGSYDDEIKASQVYKDALNYMNWF